MVAAVVVVVADDNDNDAAAADDDGAEEEDDDEDDDDTADAAAVDGAEEEDDDDDDIAACEVALAGVGITGFSFEALRDDVKASVCSRRMPSDMYHINSHILSLIYTQQRQPTFRHVLLFPNVLQAVV